MNRRVLVAAVVAAILFVMAYALGPGSPQTAPAEPSRGPETVALKGPPGMLDPTRARLMLHRLARSNETVKPNYDPALFGSEWTDPDGNGCTARSDVLQYWTGVPRLPNECDVDGLLYDPYSGRAVIVPSGAAIDHVVGLVDAWRGGADEWSRERRAQFYSDARNLIPSSRQTLLEKGNKGPDEWLPQREYWCNFASVYVSVKAAYGLTITDAQAAKVEEALRTCLVLPLQTMQRSVATP